MLRFPPRTAVNVADPFASFLGATGPLKRNEDTRNIQWISILKFIHTWVADF